MSKRLALLVGMTAYPDERLAATATNAEIRALVEWLRDSENGRFDRVVPLLNQTAVDLQLGIASFFEQELAPDDLILFYFAGHSLIHHQNIYLATADTFTEEYLDATTVEIDFVRRRLNAAPAQQIVLLDCGFSLIGATDRHTKGTALLTEAFAAENRAALAGTGLTPALIIGLQGAADSNRDGAITVAELNSYIKESFSEETPIASAVPAAVASLSLTAAQPTADAPPPAAALPPAQAPAAVASSPEAAGSPKRRRTFLAALLVLLLLALVFGIYAASSGLFSGGSANGRSAPTASPTTAAINPETSPTLASPTRMPTKTAVPTTAPPASPTPMPSHTATVKPTSSPTHEATASPTATAAATATNTRAPSATPRPTNSPTPPATATPSVSPTPAPTSVPVPMTIVAQQAFLRAGPGIYYRILAYPGEGTAVTILARNDDGDWFNAVLADGTSGWLYQDVIAPDEEMDFNDIAIAATIPAPVNDFYDAAVTLAENSLSAQVYHTYIGTLGQSARFEARLLPETTLVQPTYPNGQNLGFGLLTADFRRVGDGAYTSRQVEFCMVSEAGQPFFCQTFPARKTW